MISDCRVLFVLLPFSDLYQPNLAVSILKQCLTRSGYQSNAYYASFEFADTIGHGYYKQLFQSNVVFGADRLFSHALNGGSQVFDGEFAVLQKAASYVDDYIERLTDQIIDYGHELVGFNLSFHTVPAIAVARRLKEKSPRQKIVFGGANCDNEMGHAMHETFPWIDFVCRGEGENLIVQLAEHLSGKRDIETIKGLVWRNGSVSVCNGNRTDVIENLDDIPSPDFSDWYSQLLRHCAEFDHAHLIMPFESSRGCWHGAKQKCFFCGLCAENLTYRTKSAEGVLKEIRINAELYKTDNFCAMDLVLPNEYFKTFMPQLAKGEPSVRLAYSIRATLAKDKIQKLGDASVSFLLCGIESLNTNILKLLRKGSRAFHNIRLLKWALESGINILWFILYGIPGEQKEDYDEMISLLPMLYHLLPPKAAEPVEMHRFSPLYNERESLGLKNVRPNYSYHGMYKVPSGRMLRLSYFFEFDFEKNHSSADLKNAVKEWQTQVGESKLFYIESGENIYIYDSRPVAIQKNYAFEGLKKLIYLACDGGATFHGLLHSVGIGAEELHLILEGFCSAKLMLYVDNRYLSLAVKMKQVPFQPDFPEASLDFCAEIYKHWIVSMLNKK